MKNKSNIVITPYVELPDDAPIYQCDKCTWRCQPDELKASGLQPNCPHCQTPLIKTTKKANLKWREDYMKAVTGKKPK